MMSRRSISRYRPVAMPKDDVDPIPSISASAMARGGRRAPAARRRHGAGATGDGGGGGGAGLWLSGRSAGSLLVAIGACAWAWQLQERLTQTGFTSRALRGTDRRARGSPGGYGRGHEPERRRAGGEDPRTRFRGAQALGQRLEDAPRSASACSRPQQAFRVGVDANQQTIAATQQQLGKAREDLAALQRVGGDLERLMTAPGPARPRSSAWRMRSTASTWNWRALKSASAATRSGSVRSTPSARAPTPVSASCRPAVRALQSPVAPELQPRLTQRGQRR
jgi:hypothetical protein